MKEISNEDKGYWIEWGEKKERDFCEKMAPYLKIQARRNPERKYDKFAPDLEILQDGKITKAELKYRETPFFTAGKYKMKPQTTFTFNKKDYERYTEKKFVDKYGDIPIYIWIHWKTLSGNGIKVNPFGGVWLGSSLGIKRIIDTKSSPLHKYKYRVDDKEGNAKESYLLDVSFFRLLRLIMLPQENWGMWIENAVGENIPLLFIKSES